METDKITLADLSIFEKEEEFSIFHKLNFTFTTNGKEQLRKNLSVPLNTIGQINEVQDTIRFVLQFIDKWPRIISNGTVMVIEQFYESPVVSVPANPSGVSAFYYRLVNAPDFSLVKYSTGHCYDLIKGMKAFNDLLLTGAAPLRIKLLLEESDKILDTPSLKIILRSSYKELKHKQVLQLAHFFRYKFKNQVARLLKIFAQLDAWYSMAKSVETYRLTFPEFTDTKHPYLETSGMYHLLIKDPVPYDLSLDQNKNFLFLTGANMGGKSTFIKSVGAAVYLAHLGMAVPAVKFKLGLFDGLLSNINVMDNISKGESYFYNEVQRIKSTILRINDGRKWLILIDELFKGTNVQDAMKCSIAVIEGFIKMKTSAFILSTHLYEISDSLKDHENISFYYFETSVTDEQLRFSYRLKPGVSNDRLGYLILKREGVVKMLGDL